MKVGIHKVLKQFEILDLGACKKWKLIKLNVWAVEIVI